MIQFKLHNINLTVIQYIPQKNSLVNYKASNLMKFH